MPRPTKRNGTAAVAMLVIVSPAAVLTGCAGATTDPRAGGLAGGINALATGAYDKRLAEREAALRDLDAAETALAGRAAASTDRLKTIEKEIAGRKVAIKRLKADLAEIETKMARVRAQSAILGGVRSAVDGANDRKRDALRPLEDQLATLRAMTDELESNGQKEQVRLSSLFSASASNLAGAPSTTASIPAPSVPAPSIPTPVATSSFPSAGPATGTATQPKSPLSVASATVPGDSVRDLENLGRKQEETRVRAELVVRKLKADLSKLEG